MRTWRQIRLVSKSPIGYHLPLELHASFIECLQDYTTVPLDSASSHFETSHQHAHQRDPPEV